MNIVAVLPARGGSRRLPGKNLVPLMGRPLIAWALEAARHSRHLGISRVWVSTDDPGIGAEARARGANVVMRPAALAQDDTWTEPVIQHAVESIEALQGKPADVVVWMNASVPEMQAADIDRAIEWRRERGLREVISVGEDGCTHSGVRVLTREALFQRRLSVHVGVLPLPAVDIHTERDLAAARARLERRFAWQAVGVQGPPIPTDIDWELDAAGWSGKAFMSEVDVALIEQVLRRKAQKGPVRVLEWGSGSGTVHFAQVLEDSRCDWSWLSIEHDREFAHARLEPVFRQMPGALLVDARDALSEPGGLVLQPGQLRVVTFAAGPLKPFLARGQADRAVPLDDYVALPGRIGCQFDVVLVDGRKRRRCLLEAAQLLAPGGVALLHDAWRPYYRCAFGAYPHHRRFGDILWAGAHDGPALEALVGDCAISPEWSP